MLPGPGSDPGGPDHSDLVAGRSKAARGPGPDQGVCQARANCQGNYAESQRDPQSWLRCPTRRGAPHPVGHRPIDLCHIPYGWPARCLTPRQGKRQGLVRTRPDQALCYEIHARRLCARAVAFSLDKSVPSKIEERARRRFGNGGASGRSHLGVLPLRPCNSPTFAPWSVDSPFKVG